MADETSSSAEREESFSLDLANRSVTKPIRPELADMASAKFVKIDIADLDERRRETEPSRD